SFSFFHNTPPTEIYTLSLHDALPIFPSPISPLEVLKKLEEGEQHLGRFTVIEGWSRWDIAAAMERITELKLENTDAALALMNDTDRKSTRLNSSHRTISYAVFCLKKK